MTPLDISGLIIGSATIVAAKLLVTGATMIASWVQKADADINIKQEKILGPR